MQNWKQNLTRPVLPWDQKALRKYPNIAKLSPDEIKRIILSPEYSQKQTPNERIKCLGEMADKALEARASALEVTRQESLEASGPKNSP